MNTPKTHAQSTLCTPLFTGLVTGWTFTNVADSLLTIILAVWVTELTGNVALGGATFALLGLPALASPLIGHLADHMCRKKLLIGAYFAGAIALVPLLFVQHKSELWLIYCGTAVYASVGYVTGACQSGILKDTLSDAALGHANSILSTIDQVFRVALPFLAAGGYAWLGIQPLLVVAIISYLAAASVFAALNINHTPNRDAVSFTTRDLFIGFTHLFGTQPLGRFATSMLVAMAAIGILNGIAFAFIEHLGLAPQWLGPLTVGQGIGGIAAGLCAPYLMEKFGRVPIFSHCIAVLGVGLFPLLGTSVPLVVGIQFVLGFALTLAIIAFVTERQIATPPELQGRVAAASHVLLNVPGVALTAAAAALVTVVDFRLLVLVTIGALLAARVIAKPTKERFTGG